MSASFPTMAPWESCPSCSGGPAPGARALLASWLEFDPLATSMGIYNCRSVRGSSSLSMHSCGRAVDAGVPTTSAGHEAMWRYLRALGPHARDLGIQLVIFDRMVWSAKRPSAGGAYGGVHPHRDHAHIELNRAAASGLTLATIRAAVGTTEEDDVYVIKHNHKGARVIRTQTILQAAGAVAFGEELLPEFGADGDYGTETADAVNRVAVRARLPEDGETGVDVLVLDYCRMLLEANRGGGGGLSQDAADERYVQRGSTIKLP